MTHPDRPFEQARGAEEGLRPAAALLFRAPGASR